MISYLLVPKVNTEPIDEPVGGGNLRNCLMPITWKQSNSSWRRSIAKEDLDLLCQLKATQPSNKELLHVWGSVQWTLLAKQNNTKAGEIDYQTSLQSIICFLLSFPCCSPYERTHVCHLCDRSSFVCTNRTLLTRPQHVLEPVPTPYFLGTYTRQEANAIVNLDSYCLSCEFLFSGWEPARRAPLPWVFSMCNCVGNWV